MNPQTIVEYQSWRRLCSELTRLGIDINDQDALTKRIKDWGIEYARLAKLNPNLLKESDR